VWSRTAAYVAKILKGAKVLDHVDEFADRGVDFGHKMSAVVVP
jgi:hypothetical protein